LGSGDLKVRPSKARGVSLSDLQPDEVQGSDLFLLFGNISTLKAPSNRARYLGLVVGSQGVFDRRRRLAKTADAS
jgi:hypothetical protein